MFQDHTSENYTNCQRVVERGERGGGQRTHPLTRQDFEGVGVARFACMGLAIGRMMCMGQPYAYAAGLILAIMLRVKGYTWGLTYETLGLDTNKRSKEMNKRTINTFAADATHFAMRTGRERWEYRNGTVVCVVNMEDGIVEVYIRDDKDGPIVQVTNTLIRNSWK